MPLPHQDDLLNLHLRTYLGATDETTLALLRKHLQWVEVAAGETLMTQGEPGDSMYISISGRLRAYVRNDDDAPEGESERMVREMGRGQIIGEMSLYTQAPRSATVVAIRDSVLVQLPGAAFHELLASSAAVSIALTRQIIGRLQSEQTGSDPARPVTMGLLPISVGVDLAAFSEGLAAQLRRLLSADRVCQVDAARVDRDLQQPGLARSARSAEAERRIAIYLDRLEASHDYVLLVADAEATPWTERVSRRSDELLLLADAQQPAALHASESKFLVQRTGRSEAAQILVLLHPAATRSPTGTRAWLARRTVQQHLHIRPKLPRDMARLARVQTRTAVGLVLAGGGARGLAHLGLYRALREQGVEIDFVGGTSIGAVMAALVASDQPVETVTEIARRAFKVNPTGDYNLIPLLSLISGRRLRAVIHRAMLELLGFEADAEDLWKNFYCVASNYSNASEEVLSRGGLLHAIMASIAIPGALPPLLHNGQLLCDGGTFNNFPVDVMRRQRGVGLVIGVDLGSRKPRRIELDTVPGAWALLRDRLRPRAKRRYRLPSMMAYLMNVTVLYSTSRQRQSQRLCDLYFNPPLYRVGMLQWSRFDQIVEQGRAHGVEVLAALPGGALQPYCDTADKTE
ncbi:MAG: cyclic nucleotide-binding domain-containing protein [Pseudomonadota bacterium]|nr:cyclic nucleotide-binding domain-containing protein [Pseudomonadota bacterium]